MLTKIPRPPGGRLNLESDALPIEARSKKMHIHLCLCVQLYCYTYRVGVYKGRWCVHTYCFTPAVNLDGWYQGKTKYIATTSKILTHYKQLKHIPLLNTGDVWGKWSWMSQEARRQKLGKKKPICQQVQHAKLYILTYYRLRKRAPLIALGSHQGGSLISAHGTPPRGLRRQESALKWRDQEGEYSGAERSAGVEEGDGIFCSPV